MATNYPGALDSYTTKNAGDTISESHVNNLQDAVVATETKAGTGASTPTDNKLLKGNGTGTSVWGQADNGDISGAFGAWDAGAPWAVNTSYLAATDGFVMAVAQNADSIIIYTDGSNPPTTVRQSGYRGGSEAVTQSIMCPVRKGDYWKVVAATTIYWLPLGT